MSSGANGLITQKLGSPFHFTTKENNMTITPLEDAVLRAHDFAIGLATVGAVQDMIKRSEESGRTARDRTKNLAVRTEAMKKSRQANFELNLIASARAVLGISA
jgi:hypothetical protein